MTRGAETLVVDYYGTLAVGPLGESLDDVSNNLGLNDPSAMREGTPSQFDGSRHPVFDTVGDYEAWTSGLMLEFLKAQDVPRALASAWTAAYMEKLRAPDTVLPGAREFLVWAGSVFEFVVLCSNADLGLKARLAEGAMLIQYFDAVVSSAEVGGRKPHREIYRQAAASVRANIVDCVFVGDDLVCDVLAPMAAGAGRAIWINPNATRAIQRRALGDGRQFWMCRELEGCVEVLLA